MNSFDRIRATLNREKTDRVPVIPEVGGITAKFCGRSLREYFTDAKVLSECQLGARDHFGYDAVFAFSDLAVEAEAIGCELEYPADRYPHVKNVAIESIDEISSLEVPNPHTSGRMPVIIEATKILKRETKGEVPVVAHALGPLTIASRIMDIEKMLYLIVDSPDKFKLLLDYTLKVSLRFISSLLDAGADCIIIFDPSASQAVLPAKLFREFELPNIKIIFDTIKERNPETLTWYSVAGATHGVIKDIELQKVDIMTIDYLLPLGVAYDITRTLCMNGNIKPLSFVSEKPGVIRAIATDVISSSLSEGRFILGSGCEIPLDARFDNIGALVKASFEFASKFHNIGKKTDKTKCVTIYPLQKRIHIGKGSALVKASSKAGAPISILCNKSGACGSCKVQIIEGESGPLSRHERLHLAQEQIEKGYRLACRLTVESNMSIYIPPVSQANFSSARSFKGSLSELKNDSLKSILKVKELAPSVRVVEIGGGKHDSTVAPSDWSALTTFIGETLSAGPTVLKIVSDFQSITNRKHYCVIDEIGNKVMDVSGSPYVFGLAIDIGTTNLALYIHNLTTGELLAFASFSNPQSRYGDNIMARALECIKNKDTYKQMHRALIGGINRAVKNVCAEANIETTSIYKVVVVGNTVMQHTFLNLELKNLVRAPYIPTMSIPYKYSNTEADKCQKLSINKNATILLPPIMDHFVGSDITAGLMASGICESHSLTLFLDFGTNGEMVLGNRDKILVTSVAAGPAFESCHVKGGRSAGASVINRVEIDEEFRNHYRTIDGNRPIGFCGSAVVDIIASLLNRKLLTSRGRLLNDSRCRHITDEGYILVPKQESAYFDTIIVTNKDIEEIQKAKGAVMAAVTILLNEYGVSQEQLDRVILTGSLGLSIDIKNAMRIGLLPQVEKERISYISNAAGIGARACLLSRKAEQDIQAIAKKSTYIDLANHVDFTNTLIDTMHFQV